MSYRRKHIEVNEKYHEKLEDMLLGDCDTARRAKQSLHMSSLRMQKSNPVEARLLKQLSKRIRI